jgi:hypothetical protein
MLVAIAKILAVKAGRCIDLPVCIVGVPALFCAHYYHFFLLKYCIIFSIVRTFFIENDAEILHARYTWKVAFTNLIHKQSIQVKL